MCVPSRANNSSVQKEREREREGCTIRCREFFFACRLIMKSRVHYRERDFCYRGSSTVNVIPERAITHNSNGSPMAIRDRRGTNTRSKEAVVRVKGLVPRIHRREFLFHRGYRALVGCALADRCPEARQSVARVHRRESHARFDAVPRSRRCGIQSNAKVDRDDRPSLSLSLSPRAVPMNFNRSRHARISIYSRQYIRTTCVCARV